MYRYRMGKGIGGIGILLFIAAVVLIIIGIGQLTKPDTSVNAPSASTPTFAQSVQKGWDSGVASVKRLWQLLTNQDGLKGSGDDLDVDDDEEPDTPTVQVDMVQQLQPTVFAPVGSDVQVILYSTHTHEAFTKTDGQDYKETAQWRTDNNDYNIVKVGQMLAQLLSTQYGIGVAQDKTDTEIPVLATSYSRSLVVAKNNIQEYPDAQIIIDLHRDAYNTNINPNTVTINGVKAARVMFVIGTGEGQTGVGFKEKPDWKSNLALAQTINNNLKAINPVLSRDISVKTGRYNHHLSKGSVLIEVGNNENTLDEVLATVPFLAQAIAKTLDSMPVSNAAASATPSATASASPSAPAATSSGDVSTAPDSISIEPIFDDTTPPTPSPTPSPTASASGDAAASPTPWYPMPR